MIHKQLFLKKYRCAKKPEKTGDYARISCYIFTKTEVIFRQINLCADGSGRFWLNFLFTNPEKLCYSLENPVTKEDDAMKIQRREQKIISLLETRREISVNELSAILDCSLSTIRKHLAVMEEEGLLIRTYGGARVIDRTIDESFDSKMHKGIHEKRRIAEKAKSLIPSGATVALGSGTTVYNLSNCMDDLSAGVVYTNSMQVAVYLSNCPKLEMHVISGIVRGRTGTIIGSEVTEFFRESKNIDYTFIGCDAIDSNGDIFNDNLAVAAAERTLLFSAKNKFILCDSSKFGKRSTARIANLRECSGLITSGNLGSLLDIYRNLTKVIIG